MREKHRAAKTLIWLTASLIVLPLMVLLVWCFANRWAYPSLLPENFSLRGLEQVLFGYHDMGRIVGSSILISVVAAVLCVTASALAARAVVFYDFKGKRILEFLTMIPVIIPATVFGMGIHMMFIKGGLNHTITGVILTHIVVSLPYGVKIMTDITKLYGRNLEEQAMAKLLAGRFSEADARHCLRSEYDLYHFLQPVFSDAVDWRRQGKDLFRGHGAVYPKRR